MKLHLARVLKQLKGVQKRAQGFMALCPAHRDHTPSLSIAEGEDGRVLLKCFAGCDVEGILRAAGLKFTDLFPERLQHSISSTENVTVKSLANFKQLPERFLRGLGLSDTNTGVRIPYFDISGAPTRSRLRRSLDSRLSSWDTSTGPICLYGLWRLPGIGRRKYLVLVEGESDCWTLWRHGFPAIGCPGASTYNLIDLAHVADLDRMYVVYEPDDGGPHFSFGVRKRLEDLGFTGDIYETRLPDGIKDPSQLYLSSPKTFSRSFQECLDASVCIRPTSRTGAEWEAPVAFEDVELPAFPTSALPAGWADFVAAVAEATQTPPDLAGMLSLAMYGAACAKKFVVRVRDGYTEPTNLFVLVVLPPANRKSAVFRLVTAPFTAFEQQEAARMAPVVAAEREQVRIEEETLKKLREKASDPDGTKRSELIEQARNLAEKIALLKTPRVPRLVVDDCTPERLASLLKEQGGRIALLSPEGDAFDIIAGRYSQDRGANLGIYLKGHSGDDHRVERNTREDEHIAAPALTIGLTVQPAVARELAGKPGFQGRGLLGRFLYSYPKSLLGHRKAESIPVNISVQTNYAAALTRILAAPMDLDEPAILKFSPEGYRDLVEFQEWLEPKLDEFGPLGYMSDWAGKLVGAVVRIAGILHVAQLAESGQPLDHADICRATVGAAITLACYLIPHAQLAYMEMGADPVTSDAKYVLRWLTANHATVFAKRELHQACRSRFKRVDQVEVALLALARRGYIREKDSSPVAGPGRKPSPQYEVNPFWLAQKARNTQNPAAALDSEQCEHSETTELDVPGSAPGPQKVEHGEPS